MCQSSYQGSPGSGSGPPAGETRTRCFTRSGYCLAHCSADQLPTDTPTTSI